MNMKNIKKTAIFLCLNSFLALILNLLKNIRALILQQVQNEREKNKYYLFYGFILWLTLFNLPLNGLITESDQLQTVLNYIDPDTLVIFDIDNTLARPAEELSSDEWFCHKVNAKMAEGHDYITSIYYALPATYYAQFNVPLQATECYAALLLADLIDQNIPIMALTTRSLFVAERTFEQLEDISIRFLLPNVSQDELVLQMPHPCFYRNSILFGGNNDKGEVLITFFHWMNYYPKKVIFIDDKMKYLLAVEKALKHYNIEFVGIRYTGCDDRVETFDPVKAESQWQQLRTKKHILKENR